MPEYGRHVQKMIEYVVSIPDKEKRNEQIRAVVGVMGTLNPQLRDLVDFKHKLWDHVHIISNFEIDIDSPYPTPTRDTFSTKPQPVPIDKSPLKAPHYGRNIQNMVEMIAKKEEGEEKDSMVLVLAHYMRQQYLTWNKESVSDETIFNDIKELSNGTLVPSSSLQLTPLSAMHSHNGGHSQHQQGHGQHQQSHNQYSQGGRQNFRQNKKKLGKRKSQ